MSSIPYIFVLLLAQASTAQVPAATTALLREYRADAALPLSTEAGESFWRKQHGQRSCTTCHTKSLYALGNHQKTKKIIQPMAPSINPERFTDPKKVKKWFLRNCKWTIGRECTAQEKGDVLQWLSQQ
jgi:hypothetical protein